MKLHTEAPPLRVAFMGPPASGKSTLISAIRKQISDMQFFPEAAREIIKKTPAIVQNPEELQLKILLQQNQDYMSAEPGKLSLYDRIQIDYVIYKQFFDPSSDFTPEDFIRISQTNYNLIFVLPPNYEFYKKDQQQDQERGESWEQILRLNQLTVSTLHAFRKFVAQEIVYIDNTPEMQILENRVEFIINTINEHNLLHNYHQTDDGIWIQNIRQTF